VLFYVTLSHLVCQPLRWHLCIHTPLLRHKNRLYDFHHGRQDQTQRRMCSLFTSVMCPFVLALTEKKGMPIKALWLINSEWYMKTWRSSERLPIQNKTCLWAVLLVRYNSRGTKSVINHTHTTGLQCQLDKDLYVAY
jgi:hypothetical protein